jgi:hypothetical protein
MSKTQDPGRRCLLATMTKEPFMPVRLYYSILGRAFVTSRLQDLRCMVEVPSERCWHWLFHAESAEIEIGAGYEAVSKERRPIILGWPRFPKNGGMTIQTNSAERAIAAARFFGPRLGSDGVALRVRIVNRCFAADDGRADDLMKKLDRDVTVVDPREGEAEHARDFADVRTMDDTERAAKESLDRRIKSKKDVPMVEDFPLAPEEETPEFRDLATTLQLHVVRAFEHWNGNTHLTLAAIIVRMVEAGMRKGEPGA